MSMNKTTLLATSIQDLIDFGFSKTVAAKLYSKGGRWVANVMRGKANPKKIISYSIHREDSDLKPLPTSIWITIAK